MPNLFSFVDELEKLSYGDKEHQMLQRRSHASMGVKTDSRGARRMMSGNVRADSSPFTHPHMPATSKVHGLGAPSVGAGRLPAYRMRGKAVRDLAASSTNRGFMAKVRGHAAHREIGLAGHSAVDPYAHVDKASRGTRAQEAVIRNVPGGRKAYGAQQHSRAGLRHADNWVGRTPILRNVPMWQESKLDDWSASNAADRRAARAATQYGDSTAVQLESELARRGVPQNKVQSEAKRLLSQGGSSSRRVRAAGRALRWARRLRGR
jgi:hypothetical protein